MFSRSVIRTAVQVKNARGFGTSVALRDVKHVSTPMDAYAHKLKTPGPEIVLGPQTHRCSNFDRWMLVWVKKFPSKDQVPNKVGLDVYLRAQSKARIKTTNMIMIAGTIGCIGTIIAGKRDAKARRSWSQENLDYHEQLSEEYKREQAAAAAAAVTIS